MYLTFYHFKNYEERVLTLSDTVQLLIGNNGSGKSTLCEGISLLANVENSHHTSWQQKCSFHTSQGQNKKGEWALRWQIGDILFQSIYDGQHLAPHWFIGERSLSKPKYEIEMPYRALWIQSDHLRIISGEPSERRNFLDDILVLTSPNYNTVLRKYRTALTSRNRVIQSILEGNMSRGELTSWNKLFADYAVCVIQERRKLFSWIASSSLDIQHLALGLPGPVRATLLERHPLEVVDQDHFLRLLTSYEERDIVVGRTTVGPHLDEIDFSVELQGEWQATKYILSRGENKMLLLAFIRLLGEYVRQFSGKLPLFLLDDVLSELDENHTHILCHMFENTTTIMTTQPNHTAGILDQIPRINI